MTARKCIFTGLVARNKNLIVPKTTDEDVSDNWANSVPCHQEYGEFKKSRLPTDDEIEAMKIFFKMEMAKIEVANYTAKLEEIQRRISPIFEDFIKEKQIKKALIEKDIVEEVKIQVKDLLTERKKNLFE